MFARLPEHRWDLVTQLKGCRIEVHKVTARCDSLAFIFEDLFKKGVLDRMWTLYDPLARANMTKGRSVEPKVDKACKASAGPLPTTLEKLWFLLEPTSSISRQVGHAR